MDNVVNRDAGSVELRDADEAPVGLSRDHPVNAGDAKFFASPFRSSHAAAWMRRSRRSTRRSRPPTGRARSGGPCLVSRGRGENQKPEDKRCAFAPRAADQDAHIWRLPRRRRSGGCPCLSVLALIRVLVCITVAGVEPSLIVPASEHVLGRAGLSRVGLSASSDLLIENAEHTVARRYHA